MEEDPMLSQRTGEPPGPYQSVWDRFIDACSEHADRPAIIAVTGARPATMADVTSYAELRVFAERIARCLEQSHGIRRGSRVATLLPAGAGGSLVFWAVMRLQATFFPINPALRTAENELGAILGDLKPDILIVPDEDDDFNHLSSQAKSLAVSDLLGPSSMNGEGGLPTPPEDNMNSISSSDAAAPAICFLTSGTSSTPKACIHSQLNLSAAALAQAQSRCLQPNDRLCQQMPQFHAYGFSMSLAFWLTGAAVVYPGMSFDASASVQAMEKYGCTVTAAVPTMIHAMANHVAMTNWKLEKLRSVDIAGSVVHEGALRICVETLGVKKAAPSYGMTECPAVLATSDKEMDCTVPAIDEIAASGYPTAGVTAKICAVGTRDVVPIGTNGVLHLRGPTVVSGYLGGREPETFYDDGSRHWIITGDQAQMDSEGRVFILGRYKDLIISGGENISPLKVERVLDACKGVQKTHVFGLPDEIEGEVVAAVIERKEQAGISSSELQNTVREQLGSSSTPKIILDLQHDLEQDKVPQTSSGKVQKNELKRIASTVLHSRRDSKGRDLTTEDTVEQLANIWAQVLYRSSADLSPDASLEGEVDSLSSIRFCSLVGRQLKKKITIKDLEDHTTIAAQAQLLSSRATPVEPTGQAKRTGPPEVDDRCFEGSPARLQECKKMANELLEPLGLDWQSDVQDIIPVNPWGSVLMKRLRPQSWNHRQSYYAPNVTADALERAIKSAAEQHDLIRTMAIQIRERQQYQLVIRSCPKWFEQMIRTGFRVGTAEDLKRLHLDDPELDFAAFPGPLFRISIATIAAGGAGIVINANHSCFDALSIEMFLEDLNMAISKARGRNETVEIRRDSFKNFADALSMARGNGTLQAEAEQAASRLQGISTHADNLWPKQRMPEWFKGNDFGWFHSDGRPGLHDERPKLNGPGHAGVYGISRSMQTPARCAFALPVFFKAALSLFNMIQTSSSRAVFCQFEAGRHWHARQDSEEGTDLADPMNIAGPTYEAVITSSELRPEDTVQDFLQRLQDEQESLSSTAHAPLDAIKTELRKDGKDGSSGHQDAELIDDLLRRQVFNWLPPTRRDFKEIEVIQVTSRSDVGILWNFRAESGEVTVNASYDDAQLRDEEVEKSISAMFKVARYLFDRIEGEDRLLEELERWRVDEDFLVYE